MSEHSDRTTYDLSFTCAGCKETTLVTVAGLQTPRALRAAELEPVKEDGLDEAILANQARDVLAFASCPHCAQRNPEGRVKARADDRTGVVTTSVFFGAMTVGAWLLPWVAWAVPLIATAFAILRVVALRKMNRSLPIGSVAANFVVAAALSAVVVFVPRFAFLMPFALGIWLFIAAKSSLERRFADASKQLRFHGVGYR